MQKGKNEHGRSMVEMLGVLAIIGVLSIGGIQGYTYAMNKYRSNNVLNEMNIASLHLATTLLSSREAHKVIALGEPYDSGQLTTEAYPFAYGCGNYDSTERSCHQEETGFWAKISDVPEKVCQQILSEAKHLPNIVEQRLNGAVVEDGAGCSENNEIMLLFNADGSGELAKKCGSGAGDKEQEEPTPPPSCPENTSENGQGGLATTLTDTATGKALNCYCIDLDTKYTDSGTCETLPAKCSTNADCNRGDYCEIISSSNSACRQDTSKMAKGTCKTVDTVIRRPKSGTNPPFVMTNRDVTFWTAINFCEALGKTLVELSDYSCAHTICPSGCDGSTGYCHASSSQSVASSAENDRADVVQEMYEAYGNVWGWMNTDRNNTNMYIIHFLDGYTAGHICAGWSNAVCK